MEDGSSAINGYDGLAFPELKVRCTRLPSLTVDQLTRCFLMAHKGDTYDPAVDDPPTGDDFLGYSVSRAHLREKAGRGGTVANHHEWIIWGGVILLIIVLILRSTAPQRKRSRGPVLGYQIPFFKYNQISSRPD